jgi:predicted unusual protein kinase regulating ubiquinone biosynthesis (AarF/ABC1/UbiB family)
MCTGLDPRFNLWDHLVPYAQKMVSEEARPGAEAILARVGELVRSLVAVPRKLDTILGKMERGEIAVRSPDVVQQVTHLERAIRQVTGGIIFTGLLLGGIQLFLAGMNAFAYLLLVSAAASLAWVIFSGRR